MKLVKYLNSQGQSMVGALEGDVIFPIQLEGGQYRTLSDLLEDNDVANVVQFLIDRSQPPLAVSRTTLLAPIDRQEVWAAGVTYRRSQQARMEESETSASCYDRVYNAPRPEIFFKSTPHRVVGPGQQVRIRADSQWNVPEPELALVLNSHLDLVGFTIGNDMSSRDIEGENPLYLPQAKVYSQSCALGPCITLADSMPAPEEIEIRLQILRTGTVVFQGTTSVSNLHRTFDNLIDYLGRDNAFPDGVILLTGTGIVPDDKFTLEPGDAVSIDISGIGTLGNTVVCNR